MKTLRLYHFIAAAIASNALLNGGCTEREKLPVIATETTPATVAAQQRVVTADQTATATDATASGQNAVRTAAEWNDIKDLTFDERARVFSGVKGLEARVDQQVKELETKRAAMKENAYVKDWDFAMKEMRDARTYLKSMGEELRNATPETWSQQKEKVGLAWVRTQEAYTKVKSSVTS